MKTQILRAVAAGALATGTLTLGGTAAQAQAGTSDVSVLHAVPGVTVDVYANGDELLTDFEPGTLTDPTPLPEGEYDLKVTEAGAGPDGDALIEANGVAVPAGANITVVAHLQENGDPTLTPFVNDTAPIAAGQARITVRHTAAAPAVDVRANEEPVFTGLTNPNEDAADLPAGTISADVVLAGTSDVAIGPADLDLAEGVSTIVYAWGSAEDGNLDLAVQTIDGLHSAPGGVPGGTGGQAATTAGDDVWLWAGAGMLLAGALALVMVGRPATSRLD
ncbi:DUF4397 domain-containing protein [Nocardioides euryhalodurans]|uniref:DUF4397 domain-containing protein n=1 Tax=Nocardioides euryhalodurans TaxID=2518370 RepID=A0A4P7GK69_9ACTN|nr:DUF4397 domain-containing protein [Nocardioides euryhalodurans]QBR92448.1 DUF4397 domain-containing protein [Nocardioides euryhalodurans]